MIKRYRIEPEMECWWELIEDTNGEFNYHKDHLAEMKAYKKSIADSLIEWHDLRENPEDLPDDDERLIIAKYNKLESFIAFNDYDITYGEYICLNKKSYTHWAYLPKPPLTQKEQSHG